MQDPLKQGLKLRVNFLNMAEVYYSNARSIKTRIETNPLLSEYARATDSNARSIKTRIETERNNFWSIRMHRFECKIH